MVSIKIVGVAVMVGAIGVGAGAGLMVETGAIAGLGLFVTVCVGWAVAIVTGKKANWLY